MSGNDILTDLALINLGICMLLLTAFQIFGIPWNWAGTLLFSVLFWGWSYIMTGLYIGHAYEELNKDRKKKEKNKDDK